MRTFSVVLTSVDSYDVLTLEHHTARYDCRGSSNGAIQPVLLDLAACSAMSLYVIPYVELVLSRT